MRIKLNRTGIFFTGLAIILTYFVYKRVLILVTSDTTTGIMISGASTNFAEFEVPYWGQTYTAINHDPALLPGQKVTVLYNRKAPNIAYVYTFYGFWLSYMLPSLILIIPWSAFALGYVDKKKVVEIKLLPQKAESGEPRAES